MQVKNDEYLVIIPDLQHFHCKMSEQQKIINKGKNKENPLEPPQRKENEFLQNKVEIQKNDLTNFVKPMKKFQKMMRSQVRIFDKT